MSVIFVKSFIIHYKCKSNSGLYSKAKFLLESTLLLHLKNKVILIYVWINVLEQLKIN